MSTIDRSAIAGQMTANRSIANRIIGAFLNIVERIKILRYNAVRTIVDTSDIKQILSTTPITTQIANNTKVTVRGRKGSTTTVTREQRRVKDIGSVQSGKIDVIVDNIKATDMKSGGVVIKER